MLFSDFRPSLWNGDRSAARRRALKKRARSWFGLERLEERVVLQASTWSGAVSDLWSNPGNWSSDTLPTTGSDLIFPSGAANLSNTDDLTSVTSYGSLALSGSGYAIGGTTAITFTSIDSSQSSSSNTISLPIDLASPATVAVGTSGAALVLNGVISGSAGLTMSGNGELDISAANTYTGTTAAQGGTLLIDGDQPLSPVTIVTGATLGGIGTVPSITATGGTLSPGDLAPGLLTDSGALTMGADTDSNNSVFSAELEAGTTPGVNYTQLQVAGPVDLTGVKLNLTLSSGFVAKAGQTYTILDNTGTSAISGTFAGLAQGSVITASGTSFTVSYTGGTNSNSVVLTELAASSTELSATPSPAVYGESVALEATVTGTSGGATPTGTVEFLNGTTSLGSPVTLNGSGVATLDVTSLPVGTNSITAVYSGDTTYGTSTSPASDVTVEMASTTTTVTFSPASPVSGQSVTLTATVAPVSPGAGTPTGTVNFYNNGSTTPLGMGTLNGSGVATLTTTALLAGTNAITATYSGDDNFATSTSTPAVDVPVGVASTTTTLTIFPVSPYVGQSVLLTATIAVVSPGGGTPTGTVDFYNNGSTTPLGTGTLNSSGVATLATTALPVGANSIVADYSGDPNYSSSDSSAVPVTVAPAVTTTTSLASSPGAPVFGQDVTLTATVAPITTGAGTPTGTVEFFNGTTLLGSGTLNGSDVATLDLTTLPTGTTSITAAYSGDATFTSSVSSVVPVTVGMASTTTTVTFSPSTPVFGQSVTLTATVAPVSPGAGVPTGTVTFFLNGTTSLGPGTLNVSGIATLAVSTLPVSTTNAITATYGGDDNFATSTSSPAVTVPVVAASTTTTLTASTSTAVAGQSVTLTAKVVAVSPGAGTPGGTVTFFNGTTSLGTGTLNALGVATLAVTTLPVATNSLTATYGATTDFATSTSSPAVTVTVSHASSTTTLTVSPTSSVYGESLTLTATIAAVSPGTGTPTGTVTFYNGTTSLGTGTLSSGVATLAVTSLPTGTASLTATYGGDDNFATSTSAAVSLTVSQASTTTTLTLSDTSPSAFESVTLTATVAAVSPGAGTPTGTVTFFNGTTSLGTATLNSGDVATLAVSSLSIGSDSITAQYNGDTNFTGSTSAATTVVIGTAFEQWLAAVYEIELDRAPGQSDVQIWDQQFANGRTRKSIALEIANSPEAKGIIVQNAFETYLGVTATQAQVTQVELTSVSTHTSVRAVILGSNQFYEESGGTLAQYVAALQNTIVGNANGNGAALYIQLSQGELPAKVAEELLLSPAGQYALLTTSFQTVLDRAPTTQETVQYLGLMEQGVYIRNIQAVLLASDEFYNDVVVSMAGSASSSSDSDSDSSSS